MVKLKVGKIYRSFWNEHTSSDGSVHIPKTFFFYMVDSIVGWRVNITFANGSVNHFSKTCPIHKDSVEVAFGC